MKLIFVSLIFVSLIGCSSSMPKKPPKPKGSWYVVNQEQIDLLNKKK